MYIEKFEIVKIILKTNNHALRWVNKLGYKPEVNEPFSVHWSILKSTTMRTLFIKVKCDDCGCIFERRIRDLDVNKNKHFCSKCQNKGERNGQFGEKISENSKKALKKFRETYGNPFTWDSVKEIIKEKLPETIKKIIKKNTGKTRTIETRKRMSDGVRKAYRDGKIKPSNGYSNIKIKQYKGIDYQGTYELRFLKFIELLGKLDLIDKGPKISYFINDVEHSYFIDFMIKGSDKVFEIKSDYYWKKNEIVNIVKKETAEKLYDYYLVINNDFSCLNHIFKIV